MGEYSEGKTTDRKEKITSLDSTRLYSPYIDFPLEFTRDFRPTFLLSFFSFLRDYNNTCVVKILDQMSINIVFWLDNDWVTKSISNNNLVSRVSHLTAPLRKPIRDNPKIFTKSEKIFLKSEKIFQIVMHLSMLSPRGGGGGRPRGFWHFHGSQSQIPHPWALRECQIPAPGGFCSVSDMSK